MLDITSDLADALRNQDYTEFKKRALAQEQFIPLLESGLALAEQGVTSIDEIIRISGWVD
jgi:MSHA biogenesis protein MshE